MCCAAQGEMCCESSLWVMQYVMLFDLFLENPTPTELINCALIALNS